MAGRHACETEKPRRKDGKGYILATDPETPRPTPLKKPDLVEQAGPDLHQGHQLQHKVLKNYHVCDNV